MIPKVAGGEIGRFRWSRVSAKESELCLKTSFLTMRNSCVIKAHNQRKLF